MGGEFLLFSSMISGIDNSAQRYEHFLYKVHKNHEHSFLEHRHLVFEVDKNWGYALEVLNADCQKSKKSSMVLILTWSYQNQLRYDVRSFSLEEAFCKPWKVHAQLLVTELIWPLQIIRFIIGELIFTKDSPETADFFLGWQKVWKDWNRISNWYLHLIRTLFSF